MLVIVVLFVGCRETSIHQLNDTMHIVIKLDLPKKFIKKYDCGGITITGSMQFLIRFSMNRFSPNISIDISLHSMSSP